jgi:hypothetical protein
MRDHRVSASAASTPPRAELEPHQHRPDAAALPGEAEAFGIQRAPQSVAANASPVSVAVTTSRRLAATRVGGEQCEAVVAVVDEIEPSPARTFATLPAR